MIRNSSPLIAGNSRKRQSAAKPRNRKVQRLVERRRAQVSSKWGALTDNDEGEDIV